MQNLNPPITLNKMDSVSSDSIHLIMNFLTAQDLVAFAAATSRIRCDCIVYITHIRLPASFGYSCMVGDGPLGALAMLRCYCGRIGWNVRYWCACWKIC